MCIDARSLTLAGRLPIARGLTLIELLIFIVIIGIAATAILGVFGSLTRNSAGLLPDKQAQAIAASMLQEVLAQPFTFCDPNDGSAGSAMSPAGCTVQETAMGAEATETRGAGGAGFDNVNDYNSAVKPPVAMLNQAPTGVTAVPSLANYSYEVTVAPTNVAGVNVTPGDALLITVTVRNNGAVAAQLQGVRIRYAPRTLPP